MVAEEAGVSETIVSYVLNKNRSVSQEKRIRVESAVKKLGYRPNAIARMLKSKQSLHILFIADKIENEHFGKMLAEMNNLLYSEGYLISLAPNRDNDEFIQRIISRQLDGVIISSISMQESYINALSEAGIPVVVLMTRNYNNLAANIGKIYPGLYDGARECINHLHANGCRDIIYIDRMSSSGHFSDFSDLRLKGYLDELSALNLPFNSERIITGCANEEEVREKIASYIKKGLSIDAIFARNDNMAAIAIRVMRELGINVPNDIKVVGFDNSNISRHIIPPLTTVEIDRKGTAHAAVELLQSMMDGKPVSSVALKTQLIVRESTLSV